MKRFLLPFIAGWCALALSAQIVTTSPAVVQTDSRNIVITYHAGQGNKGLAGLTSKVYAHTGVITSESTGPGDWKYAPTWLDNSAKYEMTYVGPDTWLLTIPDIDTYYGITSGGETVEQLMFVFRDATGSREGKTANGGDISVPVYPSGFQVVLSSSLESTVINDSSPVTLTVNTTSPSDIRLYVEGDKSNPIATGSAVMSVSGSKAFSSVGSYNIIAEATPVSGGGTTKTATMTLVKLGASQKSDYPGGVPEMGAVRAADGSVTFCIAAPGKESMVLVPSWNGYKVSAEYQMKYQDYNGYRYFWTTVAGLDENTDYIYYYLADGVRAVGDPYARLVLDPWSDKYISSDVFPDMPQYPVGSVPEGLPLAVYNSGADTYDWQVTDFQGVDPDQLVIYELLIRDFTGTEGEANAEGTVAGVMEKLDYLQSLGVNAIELLPIMEFNGNNSWGYNTNFYFAPDKAYGRPDDYRRLIDECHRRGMAVILDIVFNQSDGLHPWYQLYTPQTNPFYNASAPHAYSVLNDWKQENPLVERQWIDALKYWLTSYNVDGFRFDLVKGLGNSDSYGATYNSSANSWSGVSVENTDAYNQSRVDRMKRLHAAMKTVKPHAYFINENLAGTEEENAMAADGELNWANVNYSSIQFAEAQFSDRCDLNRFYAPLDSERLWGSTVSYAESHDEERMAYALAGYDGTANVINAIKNSEELTTRRLGSVAAAMLMSPGAHMIWQFQEFGADQTTKNESGNDTSPKKVVWSYLDNEYRAGLKDTYAALCRIRNDNPEMFEKDVNATVRNMYTTAVAGSIVLTKGDKELVLVIRPNGPTVSGTTVRDLASSVEVPLTKDSSRYQLLAASYGQSPKLNVTTGKVSLKGGAFALFGTDDLAAIDDIASDVTQAPYVYVTPSGDIVVEGDYRTMSVYDLSGRPVIPVSLSSGIYIVRIDEHSHKISVTR